MVYVEIYAVEIDDGGWPFPYYIAFITISIPLILIVCSNRDLDEREGHIFPYLDTIWGKGRE